MLEHIPTITEILKILGITLLAVALTRMFMGVKRQERMGATENKHVGKSERTAFLLEWTLWIFASLFVLVVSGYILVQALATYQAANPADYLLTAVGLVLLLLGGTMLLVGTKSLVLFFQHFQREKNNSLQFHFDDKYLIYNRQGKPITIERAAVRELQFVLPKNSQTPLRNLGYTRIHLKNGQKIDISFLLNKYFWKFEECFSPMKGQRVYASRLSPRSATR